MVSLISITLFWELPEHQFLMQRRRLFRVISKSVVERMEMNILEHLRLKLSTSTLVH